MSGWTDERIELMRKLWDEGLSATEVAKELGGVSRNAVIGKLHRLAIHERKAGVKMKQQQIAASRRTVMNAKQIEAADRRYAAGKTQRPKMGRVLAVQGGAPASFEALPPTPIREDVVIPASTRIGIFELRNNTCRWPIAEPGTEGFSYCGANGANLAANRPYCRYHTGCALAGGQIQQRKKVKA